MNKIELWRHPKMTDVAMEIMWQNSFSDESDMIGICWWNIGSCHEPWCMQVSQAMLVKKAWLAEIVPYHY